MDRGKAPPTSGKYRMDKSHRDREAARRGGVHLRLGEDGKEAGDEHLEGVDEELVDGVQAYKALGVEQIKGAPPHFRPVRSELCGSVARRLGSEGSCTLCI